MMRATSITRRCSVWMSCSTSTVELASVARGSKAWATTCLRSWRIRICRSNFAASSGASSSLRDKSVNCVRSSSIVIMRSSLRPGHALGEIQGKFRDFIHDGSDFFAIEADGARQFLDGRLVGFLQPDVFVELLRGREDHKISRFELPISLLEARYSVGNLPFKGQVGAGV